MTPSLKLAIWISADTIAIGGVVWFAWNFKKSTGPGLGSLVAMVTTKRRKLPSRETMPEFIQKLMLIAPTTHFVAIGQAILFRGSGLNVVWLSMVALLVIESTFFLIALNRFRKSISQMV